MKIACDHCEKVIDETAAFGWFEVGSLGSVSSFGDRKPEGRFCTVACFVARFDPIVSASTRAMG